MRMMTVLRERFYYDLKLKDKKYKENILKNISILYVVRLSAAIIQ